MRAVVVASLIAMASAGGQLADRPVMIEARVPKAPSVATGANGAFLVYEVWVTNLEPRELKWTRLEVMDGRGTTLHTMADSAMWRDLARPGQGNIGAADRPPVMCAYVSGYYQTSPTTMDVNRLCIICPSSPNYTPNSGKSSSTR